MVSAISAFNSMFAAMTRIDAGNRIMATNNAMALNAAAASRQVMAFGSARIPMDTFVSVQQREKELMAQSLRDRLLYKIAMQMEENGKDKKLDYKA